MTRARSRRSGALLVLLSCAVGPLGCRGSRAETEGTAAPAAAAPANPHRAAELARIQKAEYARSTEAIPKDAFASRDVEVRRGAARALSRIGDARAVELLGRSLADEDPEVVAWGAYGVGYTAAGREAAAVRALVARAASLPPGLAEKPAPGRLAVSPVDAIADALSRAGTPEAEQTLRAWLEGPPGRAESAAYALGRLAGRRHRLDDATLVALLGAAAQGRPVEGALYAFARLESVPDPVRQRLVGVASDAVRRGGERTFALRALLPSGAAGADVLAAVAADDKATAEDRTVAVSVLGRMGRDAAAALLRSVDALVDAQRLADAAWLDGHFAPLTAALAALTPPVESTATLIALAEAELPGGATPPVRRRLVALRCGAASVLAGSASQSARLVKCDPDAGRPGALAALRVLDRGELKGARLEKWRALAEGADPAVRRAALALVPLHPELPPVPDVIAHALHAKEPGVVAQAARILSTEPRRAGDAPLLAAPSESGDAAARPNAAVTSALTEALDAGRPEDQIETRVALARAAAALNLLSAKPRIELLCKHANATVRRAAEGALRDLGSHDATCPSSKDPVDIAPAAPRAATVTLTFVTDASRLGVTLDARLAPLAVDRIVELARAGFYDGVAVHRVVPGFVVQFGDTAGDGSGGSGRAPLPCETAPAEFQALTVGMALSGRDTGSSQVFVTLAREPHLYGDYPVIGAADPEWRTVAEGDVISKVEVRP